MKVTIYMKSGNKLVQRGVKEYSVKHVGDDITGLSVKVHFWARLRVLVGTVALSQIEAVTVD